MGFLIFSACLLGEGPATQILSQPCLGRVSLSPARGDGDGHPVSRYFQAFVLWWLSLAVCYASSVSQSSSGQISASVSEQRDCGPFSTDVLATLTLFLLVLLNPAVSREVCPTLGVPALSSRMGAFLSFVFLTLTAASCQPPPHAPRAPSLSLVPVNTPELRFSVWSHARSQAHGLSLLSCGCRSASPPAPQCRWLLLPSARARRLPPPSVYLLMSVGRFAAPRLVP